MKVTGELVLSFLLNASWQVMLIGAAALLGDLMLRRTAVKYRHLLWVAALALSLLLPLATSRDFQITQLLKPSPSEVAFVSLPFAEVSQPSASTVSNGPGSAFGPPARMQLRSNRPVEFKRSSPVVRKPSAWPASVS